MMPVTSTLPLPPPIAWTKIRRVRILCTPHGQLPQPVATLKAPCKRGKVTSHHD